MSREQYEELERSAVLGDDEPAPPAAKTRSQRLKHLPTHFVRVPLPWLKRGDLFEPHQRLFLYLLYRSHWGQKGVHFTNATAAEVGIAPRTKRKILQRLVTDGRIRVEKPTRYSALIVWPIVIVG